MRTRWSADQNTEINLAPLLDVIFCLLFFFILATSIKQERHALEVQIPRADQSAKEISPAKRLEILIASDNRVFLDNQSVALADLAEALRGAIRTPAAPGARPLSKEVLIRSDGRADVQTFVAVYDACDRAGLEVGLLETKPNPSGAPTPTPIPTKTP